MNPLTEIKRQLNLPNQNEAIVHARRNAKYLYNQMEVRIISDAIARLLANKMTGVVSIYLDLESVQKKLRLKKVFFCSKQNGLSVEDVSNLVRYCFSKPRNRFLPDKLKNRIAENVDCHTTTSKLNIIIKDNEFRSV